MVDLDDLEVALHQDSELARTEIARVMLMVRERLKKDWDDDKYVVYSSLVDSGLGESEVEGCMNAYFGEDEWEFEEHRE